MYVICNPTMTGTAWDPLLVSVDTPVLSLLLCILSRAKAQTKAQTRTSF